MNDGPATKYARAVDEWTTIDWWKLEARALYENRDLRRALAFFAPVDAWRDLSKGVAPAWGCLLTISHIASFTLPVITVFALMGWVVDPIGGAPVGVAGVLAGIAAVIGGIGLLNDRRDASGADPKVGRILGALHLVPATVGALIAAIAIAQGAANGPVGIVGFLADTLVGVLHFVVYRGSADTGTTRWKRNFRRLEKALDAVSPAERAHLYADIQQAIDVLGTRGTIPPDQLVRAKDVRIGLLGMTMAPRAELRQRKQDDDAV